MTNEELDAIEARVTINAPVSRAPMRDAETLALIAEVRRLCALPVIATCGACGWCRVSDDPGNVNDRCAHPSAEQSGQWPEPDATIATCSPPSWCPLRGTT